MRASSTKAESWWPPTIQKALFTFFRSMVLQWGATDRGLADALAGIGIDIETAMPAVEDDFLQMLGDLLRVGQQAGLVRRDLGRARREDDPERIPHDPGREPGGSGTADRSGSGRSSPAVTPSAQPEHLVVAHDQHGSRYRNGAADVLAAR